LLEVMADVGYNCWATKDKESLSTPEDIAITVVEKMCFAPNHSISEENAAYIEEMTNFINMTEQSLVVADRWTKFMEQSLDNYGVKQNGLAIDVFEDRLTKTDIVLDIKGSVSEALYQKPIEYMSLELFSKLYPEDVAGKLATDFSLIYGPVGGPANNSLRITALFQFQTSLMNATFGELNKILDSFDTATSEFSYHSPLVSNPSAASTMIETNEGITGAMETEVKDREQKQEKQEKQEIKENVETKVDDEGQEDNDGKSEDSKYSIDKFFDELYGLFEDKFLIFQ